MVRIALPTYGTEGLNGTVYPMFEATPYFTIVDVDESSGDIRDTYSIPLIPSFYPAFPQNPIQILLNENVNIVITGSISPQSAAMLKQNGINTYTVQPNITVKEAVDKFLKGELKESIQVPSQPTFQPPGTQYPPLMYPSQYPPSTYPQIPFPSPQMPQPFPQPMITQPRESFLNMLERQREMLEQQKWMLERQKELIEKQLTIIEDQIEKIKSKIEEIKSS